MNYIFVIEDDCCLKEDIDNEEYIKIFNTLIHNYDKYEIFNGGPGFFENTNPNKFASCFENYYFVTDCQQAQMMCYTNGGYNTILNEYNPYGKLHCDQYYARNFLQMVYKLYICNQIISMSDINNTISYIGNNIDNSEKNIYLNIKIFDDIKTNNKFEGIDGIFWINLDRCVDRKNKFNNNINKINNKSIPVVRINGIDGQKENIENIIDNYKNIIHSMNKYEIACLLSHLLAIYNIKSHDGKYFLILEDDVMFDNLKYITSLNKIIADAPKDFDILMLNKIDMYPFVNLYTKRTPDRKFYGMQSYIITSSCVDKLLKLFSYVDNKFIFNTKYISPSDWFIYDNSITYAYKYNLISEDTHDSLIHSDHLKFHNECNTHNNKILYNNINKYQYLCNISKKKFIFIDTTSHYTHHDIKINITGGSENQFYNLIYSLSKKYNVACYNLIKNNIHIDGIFYNNISDLKVNIKDIIIVQRNLSNLDIFNLYDIIKNNSVYLWMHDLPYIDILTRNRADIYNNINRYFKNKHIKFIFPSNHSKKKYIDTFKNLNIFFEDERLLIIYNILYENEFVNYITAKSNNKNNIVFASAWNKGLKDIIKLFDKLLQLDDTLILILMTPGYELNNKLICDTDWNEYTNDIAIKYKNNIKIYGKTQKDEYCKILQNSLCVLSSKFEETFGCIFLEAYYLNIPVIADINSGSVKEIIDNKYIVDYENHKNVYNLINILKNTNYKIEVDDKFFSYNILPHWHNLN